MEPTRDEQLIQNSTSARIIADRYKIIEEIGSGGMGTVYKAEHMLLHKIVALKLLRAEKKTTTDINRFQREAKAASAVHHPSLVTVHDFGATEDGELYLVMDYVQGKSLSQEISEKGPLKQDEALEVFIQICKGMAVAHKKGVLHRDLKPSNIAIEKSGNVLTARVLDFGIAKLEGPDADNTINKVTQTGEIIGSPAYMSPEQCTGNIVDSRSDIYSMGCVMFEALTGSTPFMADSPLLMLYKHMNDRAPLIKSVNPDVKVTPELERVVLQALEKDPQNRYQSMDDLAADLALVKQGKNPVKEASRLRSGLRKAALMSKIGFAAVCIVAFVAFSPWIYAVALDRISPPWRKELNRAEAQWQLKNNDDALSAFKKAAAGAIASKADKSEIAHIFYRLGSFYSIIDQHDSAIETLNKSLAYDGNRSDDPELAYTHDFLAGSYMANEDFKEAAKHAEIALRIKHKLYSKKSGADQQYTANTLWKLCRIYRSMGFFEKSEACAREWLQIELELHPQRDHGYLVDAYEELATTLFAEKKNDEAIKDASEAYKISQQIYEKDSRQRQKIAQWLVESYKYVGDLKQAEAVARESGIAAN